MAGRIALGAKDMAIAVKDPVAGTFGTMLDAPGLMNFSIAYDGDVQELRGDDQVLATAQSQVSASGSFGLGVQDLAVKAAMLGGTVIVVGTGGTQVTHLLMPSTPKAPIAQLAALARGTGTDGGTLGVRAYQARVTSGGGIELSDGDYATSDYDFTAVGFNGAYFAIEQYAAVVDAVASTAISTLPVAS